MSLKQADMIELKRFGTINGRSPKASIRKEPLISNGLNLLLSGLLKVFNKLILKLIIITLSLHNYIHSLHYYIHSSLHYYYSAHLLCTIWPCFAANVVNSVLSGFSQLPYLSKSEYISLACPPEAVTLTISPPSSPK